MQNEFTTTSIVVTGSFDDLKSRGIRFLQEAAKLGDLTVMLWSDEAIRRVKAKSPRFPETERLYFLRAIRYVHRVELIDAVCGENALPEIATVQPAVWAVEESQANDAKTAFCAARGLQYCVLPDEQLRGFPEAIREAPRPNRRRKKVLVTGCYDWFHSGHVRFFEEASGLGDLYVVVGHDANIRLLKGPGRPVFPESERRYVVGSIRFVLQALVSTGHGWLDAEPEIKQIRPDIYAVNEDGDVPEKREYCRANGLEYVVLQRKPAPGLPQRSSTELRGF